MSASATMPTLAVLKFGGEVVADAEQLAAVWADVATLQDRGWRFVVVHGGGPQTSALGERLGVAQIKVAGQRVTDAQTLRVACQAIAGETSTLVVAAAWAAQVRAVGLSAGVVHAERRPPVTVASEGGKVVDYGLVGDISRVEVDPIEALWERGLTPVLNPIGIGSRPGLPALFNINADTVAAALAVELGAAHLFLITSVAGVLRDRQDPSTRIPHLDAVGATTAIAAGVIAGGMIPKVEAAVSSLSGESAAHILAAQAGALLAEAEAPGSCGTVFGGRAW